jgi:outer membrane protein assembly factor BamA
LDGRDQTYGLGLLFENVDYRFNPTRGWIIRADIGLGRKRIIENPRLHDALYEDLDLELPKREAEFELWWFHRFGKRWVLALGERAYWLDQRQYFQNDLLQVGGSRSIRGFNENEFFTNFYSLSTAEWRFLLEKNSYLFVFGDYAYLENATAARKVVHPTGFGLGMTYETRAGMVSLTYAAGRVEGQAFAPSRGRIHVGLINQF